MHVARLVAFAGLVTAFGCSSRPEELTRRESLDEACGQGMSAYTYPLRNPDGGRTSETLLEPAVSAGCSAPGGAWTDVTDQTAGGVRQEIYELRENEQTTLLCCP